jgi:hypothetical protein
VWISKETTLCKGENKMTRHIVFRIIAAVVLIAAIAGIAFLAYGAGVAQNVPATAQLPAAQTGGLPYPYFHGWWGPFPFFGFGCFAPLAVLFLLCVAFGSMRRMIFGPRWGWHRMHRHGGWSEKDGEEGVPPMVSEWHRRMHGETDDETPKK